jgi:hypothetical protein
LSPGVQGQPGQHREEEKEGGKEEKRKRSLFSLLSLKTPLSTSVKNH